MLRKFWVGGKEFLLNSWACIAADLYWIAGGYDHILASAFAPPQSIRWRETLSHLPALSHRGHSLLCEANCVLGWCCDIMAKHVLCMGADLMRAAAVLFRLRIFCGVFIFLSFFFRPLKLSFCSKVSVECNALWPSSAASRCTLTSQDEDPYAETTAELACNEHHIWHFILNSTFLTCVN